MATRDPDSPSAYTVPLQAHGGPPSPRLEIHSPPGTLVPPSEAAHPLAGYSALYQDFDLADAQHDHPATPFDIDAVIASFNFAHADFPDIPGPYSNNEIGQSRANNPETGPSECSQPVQQLRGFKRAVSSSPPPGFTNKRWKVTHKSFTPREEPPASPRYDRSAQQLVTAWQPSKAVHTNVRPSGPMSTISAMTDKIQKPKRSFQCAFRKAQAKLGLPYTCTAAPVSTVSAGRTHLIRKLPKDKPPHLPFLKLCTTCNEDFLDELEFETYHGKDGLKCETPRPQRKGDAGQQEQYDILCSKVEAFLVAQCNKERVEPSRPAIHVDQSQPVGATEALETDPTPFEEASSTNLSTHTISYLVRTGLHQNLHQDHGWHRAPTTPTSNSVDLPDESISYRPCSSILTIDHPVCDSLEQDVSHEDPMVVDYMDDDTMLGDHMLTKESSSVRAPTRTDGAFGTSLQALEDPAHRQYHPLIEMDCSVAQSNFGSSYSTSLDSSVTSCTSSIMTPTNEPNRTLLGDYSYSGYNWTSIHAEEPWSPVYVNGPRLGPKYVELHHHQEPELYMAPQADKTDNPLVTCDQCDKSFSGRYGKGNLRRHVLTYHNQLPMVEGTACRVCKKAYKRADATRKHEWKKHNVPDAKPKKRPK